MLSLKPPRKQPLASQTAREGRGLARTLTSCARAELTMRTSLAAALLVGRQLPCLCYGILNSQATADGTRVDV